MQMMPSVEMEFLANYLTELTLIECQFLKYLPSVIAASAVFLAKWTMNQSSHPWVCSCFLMFCSTNIESHTIFIPVISFFRMQHLSITQRIKPRISKNVFRPCKICSSTPKDVP